MSLQAGFSVLDIRKERKELATRALYGHSNHSTSPLNFYLLHYELIAANTNVLMFDSFLKVMEQRMSLILAPRYAF